MNRPHATDSPAPASPGSGFGLVEVTAVSKAFGATAALITVSLSVAPGEARALVGRNGAGKSTLVSLLTGLQTPDSGEVRIAGRPAAAGSPDIACVYQHSRLIPALTVAENLVLGRYPRRWWAAVDWRRVQVEAEESLTPWGLATLASTPVEQLDPVQAKVVEICRALGQRPRVLLLDEPTAGLDGRDAERLYDVVAELKRQGTTIVYVSHRLGEIYRLCDSVTVLRDARHVISAPLDELPMRELVRAMVGDQDPAEIAPAAPASDRPNRTSDGPGLVVRGLSVPGKLHGVDLEVRGGVCLGIAGIDGSGKVEFGAVLAGLLKPAAGEVVVNGRRVPPGSVRAALAAGIAYVPPDRRAQGMVAQLSVSENTTMTVARALAHRPARLLPRVLLRRDRERAHHRLAVQWQIVASSAEQAISELSGGNQQKCVMARGLATDPAILVLQNPTAGIDIAAKASIMGTLRQILDRGACIIVISEDADDFALCSRILVMVNGRIAESPTDDWTEGELVAAMQGVQR